MITYLMKLKMKILKVDSRRAGFQSLIRSWSLMMMSNRLNRVIIKEIKKARKTILFLMTRSCIQKKRMMMTRTLIIQEIKKRTCTLRLRKRMMKRTLLRRRRRQRRIRYSSIMNAKWTKWIPSQLVTVLLIF